MLNFSPSAVCANTDGKTWQLARFLECIVHRRSAAPDPAA